MTTPDAVEHETTHRIVCAVGDDGSRAALACAADEARRTGARLHLVRVTGDPHDPSTDALLLDAMVTVHASHPGLAVTRDVVEDGWIALGLAHSTRPTDRVVIERTAHGRLHRLLSGSTADGIARGVAAPVLSVPRGWRADGSGPVVVTVAVQDASEVPALVGLAASEAADRGADLVVLHATSPNQGFDAADVDMRQDWLDRAHLHLDPAVQAAVAHHVDLKVRLDITADRPVDAVVRASAGSQLLVLGRRHHEHAWGTHLGPVVRRALLEASCPVLLAPDHADSDAADAAAQAAGSSIRDATTVTAPGDTVVVPGDIVVAVGPDDAGGSVRFAVAEAAARGVGIHLVHVVRLPAVDGVSIAEVWRDAVSHGTTLLDRAAAQAREAGGDDLGVGRRLIQQGGLVRGLVDEAAHAGAIVVQHRHLGAVRRLATRSVTSGIAARSDVAVIAVPATWTPGPERIGCVVVGLQDPGDLEHVLPVAIEEASRRHISLRVVHAGSQFPQETRSMVAAVDALRDGHRGVTVDRVFADRDPVDLLVGAMTAAELVVVGRRRHGLVGRSHLGPVAREVLDRSPYPVLLVPPTR